MRTDSEIRHDGFMALHDHLDPVEIEKFIALVNRSTFDYTQWRASLWVDESVDEISAAAERYCHNSGVTPSQ